MKRRSFLLGGVGMAMAARANSVLWRPKESNAPHNPYFENLNKLLKRDGPGRPVMLIDVDRMHSNIDFITDSVGRDKTYRVVVKSLPSVPLLKQVMERGKTNALMLFHQPFINAVAEAFPNSDALVGKPMPVAATETFYRKLQSGRFDPSKQLQWLIDTPERLLQYQALAKRLGVKMRINFELDLGLHRGGLAQPAALAPLLKIIKDDPMHLEFSGLMGYEPQLTGLNATLKSPAVIDVLDIYKGFINQAKLNGADVGKLTLNGAGSHTLDIYRRDYTMNDLSAGSAVVKPMDFDTHHLTNALPAVFIATPILKRYDNFILPGNASKEKQSLPTDPNMQRLFFIYGGYWKARMVSPSGIGDPIYQSTNQSPISTSTSVDLEVDDYMFLRPTQSEHVMLQFGDLLPFKQDQLFDSWPIFHQTS